MNARLVVFDLDGTLVDSSRDLATAMNRCLARVAPQVEPLPHEAVRGFIGDGARMLVSRCLAARALELPQDEVLAVFLECYRGCLLDTTALYPGVLIALDALADRRLAVLTNKPGDMSRLILDGLGITARFFRVYGGGDLPERKPDPVGLHRLMLEAGTRPEETVMVGDSAVDVLTARAAGTPCVGVGFGLDPEGLRREPPDALVEAMQDLPAALASVLTSRPGSA